MAPEILLLLSWLEPDTALMISLLPTELLYIVGAMFSTMYLLHASSDRQHYKHQVSAIKLATGFEDFDIWFGALGQGFFGVRRRGPAKMLLRDGVDVIEGNCLNAAMKPRVGLKCICYNAEHYKMRDLCKTYCFVPSVAVMRFNTLAADAAKVCSAKDMDSLRDLWSHVVFFIVDEISSIGSVDFGRMCYRMQQDTREYFIQIGLHPNEDCFGELKILLIGDFAQFEPIGDVSLVDRETVHKSVPKGASKLWKLIRMGRNLVALIRDAWTLRRVLT